MRRTTGAWPQRLTVHAGMRYEYEFLPLPQQPNAALDAVFGAVGATSVFPEDRNNFGPRLGVAWAPFGVGRGVVRMGYGVYFGKLPGATVRAALLDTAMASSVTRVRILPTTETVCPQNTEVGFGYACSYVTEPTGVVAATTSAMVFDRRFRLPMVQQGTLSLEHEVGWGVLGSARYEMNLDRQLPNSVDINIAPSTDVQEFELQGGTGAVGSAGRRDVCGPGVLAAGEHELRAGDGRGFERECELQRADAGGAARTGRARRVPVELGAGWSFARRGRGRRRSTSGRTRVRCRGRMGSSTRSPCATTRGCRR